MSVLVARLVTFRQNLAFELERFWLLWSYQHHLPPLALWWRLALKRWVDLVGGGALFLVASPVMAALALVIKLLDARGPILFVQERMGQFGRVFRMYKFRTMVRDAEASTGPVWAWSEGDPRVTRMGRWLRRTHLDELPQLLNVVKGDMSLVGPRPERPCFVQQLDRLIPRYEERLLLKPGITGLAQVHYRYDQTIADVKKKLRYDLLYVRRMCLMLDARIAVWTCFVLVTGRGIK